MRVVYFGCAPIAGKDGWTKGRGMPQFISRLALFFAQADEPGWKSTWPFGPGYSEGFLSVVLKFALIAVILGGIALFLRVLFGPGGPMRDKEFDERHDSPDDDKDHD
jgi:hypothetical protein